MVRNIGDSLPDLTIGLRPKRVLNPEMLSRPAFLEECAEIIGLSDMQSLEIVNQPLPERKTTHEYHE